MQIEDPTKPTNLIGIDSSWSVMTPPTVSDGSQPSKTDSSGLSGGFRP